LRKKLLGVDKVHMYDLYTPLVRNANIRVSYEEALEMVEKGLKPLGLEYNKLLVRGFNSRWIDVYENQGKTNGAYSWGSYDTHPYVLLNYNNTVSDVSTVAHEIGHSIHSYLTRKEQPYVYSEYTLFSAEVASTTNEALLIDYLLKNTNDKGRKMFIINQYLEEIRTTVYRQTMFAEFEKIIHEKAEAGEALTSELLCSIWHDINVRYYGPDAAVDEEIDIEWARISHFYWNFYVYKYVTGYAAATSLSRLILENGEDAVNSYFKFLKSGNSDYSINLLKDAGVDMTTPEPLINTVRVFESLLAQMEKIEEE
jgi:oligoendopeptidase F